MTTAVRKNDRFFEPVPEEEANAWLLNFLLRYNSMGHRSEPHTRFEDWLENLPPSGLRAMCTWERFPTFAREPERRKVGSDARVTVAGTSYVVDAKLAGETVLLWWGLLDNELYVEHGDSHFGPYLPWRPYSTEPLSRLQKDADREPRPGISSSMGHNTKRLKGELRRLQSGRNAKYTLPRLVACGAMQLPKVQRNFKTIPALIRRLF